MAIAHVCVNCGRDLARVRPQREPHYGLNLITCPDCQAHSVRREHPIARGWHRGRRTGVALAVLGTRVFITLVLTALNVFAAIGMVALWNEVRREGHLPVGVSTFFTIMLGLLAVLTGVWLTAGFEHIARWKVWLGWLAWMALLLTIVCLQGPLGDEVDPRGWADDAESATQWMLDGVRWVALPGVMGATVLMLAGLPGIAIGQGLLWLTRFARRARWRARYKRAHISQNVSWE